MKFVVLVKEVPLAPEVDTDGTGHVVREDVPSIPDPRCMRVLDRVIGSKAEGDSVIAVAMGPPQAEATMRDCLGRGADAAYLLSDPAFAGADAYATARALAAFVTRFVPDYGLIVCGDRTADGGTSQVPATLSRMLCAPQFYHVTDLRLGDGGREAVQDYGGGLRVCRVPDGAVVSMVPSGGCGRDPADPGMSAEVTVLNRVALGLGAFSVGAKGSKTRIVSFSRPETAEAVDPAEAAGYILGVIR
jgi:electron transfer flavoprotein beta subunit